MGNLDVVWSIVVNVPGFRVYIVLYSLFHTAVKVRVSCIGILSFMGFQKLFKAELRDRPTSVHEFEELGLRLSNHSARFDCLCLWAVVMFIGLGVKGCRSWSMFLSG